MNITILGCGVYGTALSTMFKENKCKIKMWDKYDNNFPQLKKENNDIIYTTNMKESLINSNLIVIAIPIPFLEETSKELKKYYQNQNILIASKGIAQNSLFAHEIIGQYIQTKNIGVISGGTFAIDMKNKNIMGLTLGTKSELLKKQIKSSLENKYLKIQYTNDLIGTEICGSLKNVMAIAYGILDGANYPESTRFLFLTEAIYEINNLITHLDGNSKTIMSYAGIDDIAMTCTCSKSRNYTFGMLIGKNSSKEIIEEYKKNNTIEGLGTTKAIYNLCKTKKINLNICNILYNIIYKNDKYTKLIEYLEKKESNF
ncbi:MAG: NAD(P)H-dependent glycerol-3-phosphate dehydrogenase [Bacilli bacterium]|nr:NAD(P)H-dependent glycerol-3-phosphate dehydrogenase [Bacilli bacterium]